MGAEAQVGAGAEAQVGARERGRAETCEGGSEYGGSLRGGEGGTEVPRRLLLLPPPSPSTSSCSLFPSSITLFLPLPLPSPHPLHLGAVLPQRHELGFGLEGVEEEPLPGGGAQRDAEVRPHRVRQLGQAHGAAPQHGGRRRRRPRPCFPAAAAASLSHTASTGGPRPWSKGGGGGSGVGWSHGAGVAKGAGGDAEGGADRMRHTTEPVPKQLQQAEEGEWEGGETGRGGPCGQPFQ